MSWTDDALVSSARAISGNAGRYMSIDSGPIALTEPRTMTSRAVPGPSGAPARSSAGTPSAYGGAYCGTSPPSPRLAGSRYWLHEDGSPDSKPLFQASSRCSGVP